MPQVYAAHMLRRKLVMGSAMGAIGVAIAASFATPSQAPELAASLPAFPDAVVFTDILQCNANPDDRIACYDRFIEHIGKDRTTQDVLAELSAATTTNAQILVDCHAIAHAVGRWTYRQTGDVSDAFNRCDLTCHSGCYHGSVELVFFTPQELQDGVEHASKDRMRSVTSTLCDPAKLRNHIALLQCVHGAGHAILHGLDYDLPSALDVCDSFPTPDIQSMCYSGVFMENITAAEPALRNVDPSQPLFPCTTLADKKYLGNCLFFQPSLFLEWGYTPKQILDTCRLTAIPDECARGYGRELASDLRLGRFADVAHICEEIGGELERGCTIGTVNSSLENGETGTEAYPYCSTLQDPARRNFCFEWAGYYSRTEFGWDAAAVRADCERALGDGAEGCTMAAAAAANVPLSLIHI